MRIAEDGGVVLDVLAPVLLKVGRDIQVLQARVVVVDDVIISIVDIILAFEDGDGVNVVIGRLVRFHEGVPHEVDGG